MNIDARDPQHERLDAFGLRCRWHFLELPQRRARLLQVLAPIPIGQQAVAADAYEAFWQDVE